MPGRVITTSLYDALLDAFRENPGVYGLAAKRVGVGHRFAKRGWERGWLCARTPWAKAIKLKLEEEKQLALREKAKVEEEQRKAAEADRNKARNRALKVLESEGDLLNLARANLGQAFSATGSMTKGLRRLAEHVNTLLLSGDLKAVTAKQGMTILRDFTFAIRSLASAEEIIIRAEREYGDPNELAIGGTEIANDMSEAEALIEIDAATAMATLMRGIGLLPAPTAEDANASADPN